PGRGAADRQVTRRGGVEGERREAAHDLVRLLAGDALCAGDQIRQGIDRGLAVRTPGARRAEAEVGLWIEIVRGGRRAIRAAARTADVLCEACLGVCDLRLRAARPVARGSGRPVPRDAVQDGEVAERKLTRD